MEQKEVKKAPVGTEAINEGCLQQYQETFQKIIPELELLGNRFNEYLKSGLIEKTSLEYKKYFMLWLLAEDISNNLTEFVKCVEGDWD